MKISVVIPAYNETLFLDQCLLSLANQSRPADEIIVVDNNSTDTTRVIALSHGVIVIDEAMQGIWAAASRGYDAAHGDIIARCDADSILPADWLARIESTMSDAAVDAVTGPGHFYDIPIVKAKIADVLYMKAYFFVAGSALAYPPLFGSNFAMRKDAWERARTTVHASREDIHDDLDLSFHITETASIKYDAAMVVGISGRPFKDVRGMARRYPKGFRSIFIHWPEQAPWRRSRQTVTKQGR